MIHLSIFGELRLSELWDKSEKEKFLIKPSQTWLKTSIENFIEEMKPVVEETDEFESRDKSLIIPLSRNSDYQDFNVNIQRRIFQSKSSPKMQKFRCWLWWNWIKPNVEEKCEFVDRDESFCCPFFVDFADYQYFDASIKTNNFHSNTPTPVQICQLRTKLTKCRRSWRRCKSFENPDGSNLMSIYSKVSVSEDSIGQKNVNSFLRKVFCKFSNFTQDHVERIWAYV